MPSVTVGDYEFPSFASLDYADEYLAGDVLRARPWAAKDETSRGRGLSSATRAMQALPWIVTPPDPTQDEQLTVVQQVCSMYAADLLAKPKLFAKPSGNSNVKTAKAGSAQVEFFMPVEGQPPFPIDLWDLLVAAGLVGAVGPGDEIENAGAIVSGICGGHRPLDGRYADYCRDSYAARDHD